MLYLRAAVLALVTTWQICMPASAAAQTVQPVKISGQPLVYMKDGRISACGIRLIGLHIVPRSDLVLMIDASFNIELTGHGLVKITSGQGTMRDVEGQTVTRHRVVGGWLKAQGEQATIPAQGKVFPGDDGFALLYVTSAESAINLFRAHLDKKTISIGVKRAGDDFERIYSGVVELTPEEMKQVSECLDEFISRMPRQ